MIGLILIPYLIHHTGKNYQLHHTYYCDSNFFFNRKLYLSFFVTHIYIILIQRWDRGKGENINSQTQKFWQTNEPNIVEFDYSLRAPSPIAKDAATKCGSNPSFACSISDRFTCETTDTASLFVNPSNVISFGHPKKGTQSCPASSGGASGCGSERDGIFISYDRVYATSSSSTNIVASPACVAMYGPVIKYSAFLGQSNTCDLLFQDPTTDALVGKWSDLNCNQGTRSLICNLGT